MSHITWRPRKTIDIKEGYSILDKQLIDFRNAGIDKVILLTRYLKTIKNILSVTMR